MVKLPWPLSNRPKQPVTLFWSKYFLRLLSTVTLLGEHAARATVPIRQAVIHLIIVEICAKVNPMSQYAIGNLQTGTSILRGFLLLRRSILIDQGQQHAVRPAETILAR